MKKCLIILIAVSFTFIGTANAEKPGLGFKKESSKR